MPRRFSVVCDDDLCERVDALAREYDLTEQEVLRQLLRRGLEASDPAGDGATAGTEREPGADDADGPIGLGDL